MPTLSELYAMSLAVRRLLETYQASDPLDLEHELQCAVDDLTSFIRVYDGGHRQCWLQGFLADQNALDTLDAYLYALDGAGQAA